MHRDRSPVIQNTSILNKKLQSIFQSDHSYRSRAAACVMCFQLKEKYEIETKRKLILMSIVEPLNLCCMR